LKTTGVHDDDDDDDDDDDGCGALDGMRIGRVTEVLGSDLLQCNLVSHKSQLP
jgi:hypothetical protein